MIPRVTEVTLQLKGLPEVTRGYKGLQRVARVTGAYKVLPGITKG